jgi:hypothetical protein
MYRATMRHWLDKFIDYFLFQQEIISFIFMYKCIKLIMQVKTEADLEPPQ